MSTNPKHTKQSRWKAASRKLLLLAALALPGALKQKAAAQFNDHIYISNSSATSADDRVLRINRAGGNTLNWTSLTSANAALTAPGDMTIDPMNGALYVVDGGTQIRRSGLDGSNPELFYNAGAGASLQSIAFDVPNHCVYAILSGGGNGVSFSDALISIDIYTRVATALVRNNTLGNPGDMVLSNYNNTLYIADNDPDGSGEYLIRAYDLSSRTFSVVFTSTEYNAPINGLALDSYNSNLYYTLGGWSGSIQEVSTYNGNDPYGNREVAWGFDDPRQIGFDQGRGMLYVVERSENFGGANHSSIIRVPVAGGSKQTVYTSTLTGAYEGMVLNFFGSPIQTNEFVNNVSCAGGSNGSIDIMPSGGLGPYTYDWGNGITTEDRYGIAAGTYPLTITDANGETETFTFTVTEPTALTASTSLTLGGCNAANSAIVLTPSGGTPSYSYFWSDGVTTKDRSGLSAGTYQVSIFDSKGCLASVSVPVEAPASVSGSASQALCAGNSTAAVNFTGSAASYNWSNSNPAIGLAASGSGDIPSFTALNAGNSAQTATITVTPQTPFYYAYLPNLGSDNVSVVNLATNAVEATIPVGDGPLSVGISPDGTRVYVGDIFGSAGNTVRVINTATNTVIATIPVGHNAQGLAVTPNGARVYVSNLDDNNVSIISTATNTVTGTVAVGAGPRGLSITPDGSRVYVNNYNAGTVSAISTATNTVIGTIAVGSSPRGTQVTPDGSRVYVANAGSASVSVISTANNSVIATIPVGSLPQGIAITPDGSRVYVPNGSSQNVSVISTATNTVIATIPVGSLPEGASVSPDGKYVYVANASSNTLSVISIATNTVVNTVAVGSSPYAIGKFVTPVAAGNCSGAPRSFTITVRPAANAAPVSVSSQDAYICAASGATNILVSGGPAMGSVSYQVNGGSTQTASLDANGSVQLPTGTITSNATYTVLSVSNGSCTDAVNKSVTVYVGNISVSIPTGGLNRDFCAGVTAPAQSFAGNFPAGTQYAWSVQGGTQVGMIPSATSGTGTALPSFTTANATNTQLSARVTVYPLITAPAGCKVVSQDYVIRVQPTPQVTVVSGADQVLCAGNNTAAIQLQANTTGITSRWTSSNTAVGTLSNGAVAAGLSTIPSFVAQNSTGNASIVTTFAITPWLGSCAGTPVSTTLTVNRSVGTIAYAGGPAFCGNTGNISPRLTGATGGSFSYQNLATGTASGLSFSTVSGIINTGASAAGNYRITYTYSGSAGACGNTTSTDISITPSVTINAQSNLNVCSGVPVAITFTSAQDGQQPLGYIWSIGNTSGSNASLLGVALSGSGNMISMTPQNPTASPIKVLVSGKVTAGAGTACGSAQTSFYITVNPCATIAQSSGGNGGSALARSLAPATESNETVTVGPNPAQGRVTVYLGRQETGSYTVQLLGQQGALTRPQAFSGDRYTLDLTGLTAGVYVLQLTDTRSGKTIRKQVVKL